MAFLVHIRKLSENSDHADYSFGWPDDQLGVLRIKKADGEIVLVQPAPNDSKNHHYFRAASKVRKSWEQGEYPEFNVWAS